MTVRGGPKPFGRSAEFSTPFGPCKRPRLDWPWARALCLWTFRFPPLPRLQRLFYPRRHRLSGRSRSTSKFARTAAPLSADPLVVRRYPRRRVDASLIRHARLRRISGEPRILARRGLDVFSGLFSRDDYAVSRMERSTKPLLAKSGPISPEAGYGRPCSMSAPPANRLR